MAERFTMSLIKIAMQARDHPKRQEALARVLLEALKSSSDDLRLAATHALEALRWQPAAPALRRAAESEGIGYIAELQKRVGFGLELWGEKK